MGGEDFLSALGSIANALFLIASIYIYIALLRQINRRDRDLVATDHRFGAAEVALAAFLIAVFAFSSLGAWSPPWPRNSSSASFFTGSYGVISVVALDSSFLRFFLLRFTCTCRRSRPSLLSESVLLLPTSGADRCWSR